MNIFEILTQVKDIKKSHYFSFMIPRTLERTKNATFQVLTPHTDPKLKGFPTPKGTGFFVSDDGYFLTARHVVVNPDGTFVDFKNVRLVKPEYTGVGVIGLELVDDYHQFDICLLKADFNKVKAQDFFKTNKGFAFLQIDYEVPPEGSEVYSFGYPLPTIDVKISEKMMIGFHYYCPRVTSAIISSHYEVIGVVFGQKYPTCYVIDKALNYGNSGGPIVLQGNGKVISLCSRFQPVEIPQGNGYVKVPSLYGVTTSLKNIQNVLVGYLQ